MQKVERRLEERSVQQRGQHRRDAEDQPSSPAQRHVTPPYCSLAVEAYTCHYTYL